MDQLTEILLYHVAPGRRDAAEVLGSERIRMANGGTTWISVREPGVAGSGAAAGQRPPLTRSTSPVIQPA